MEDLQKQTKEIIHNQNLPATALNTAWHQDEQECGEHLQLILHRVQRERRKNQVVPI